MKDVIRVIELFIVGILTATILYPLFHEVGHMVSAVIVNVDVIAFRLLPVPYVLCNMATCGKVGVIVISLGGMFFPFAITVIRTPKSFWFWYVWLIIRGICLLSFIISIVAFFSFMRGNPIANEDITQIMLMTPEYASVCFIIIFVLLVWGAFGIAWSKPITRCLDKFVYNNKKRE